ncbi:hypothetical protein BSKO_12235 [Bryopsis sp. KO-2023]|nr:hypothetical protein BSKO_12235 [Bryopsis sp. KO-2023]
MGSSRVALLKHSPQQGQPLILQRQTRLLQAPQSGVPTHSMNPDATALSKGFHQPLGGHPQNSGQPMVQQRKVYIDCTHSVAPGQGTMEITDRNMPAHPSRFQDGGGLIRPAHGHQIPPQLLAVPNSCPSTRPLVQEIVATNGDLNTPLMTQPGLQNGCDMMENRAIMANTNGPGVFHGNGRVYVDELEMHKEQAIRRSSRMLNRNDLPPQYPMPTGPPVMNYPFMQAKSDWTEHVAPDGRRYWWNKSMEESTWRKPEGIRVAEEFLASAKGWKIKTSATGRRIYEHMVTHNCSLDLPAAVQNEFEDPKKTTAAPKEKHTRQLQMSERNNSEKQMVNGASTASPAILKLEARNRQLGEMLVDREVQLENLRRQIAIFDKLGKTQGPDGIAKLVHMEGMRSELEATPLLWAFDKIVQEVGNPQQRKEIDSRAASDEQEGGGVDRGALEDDTKAKSGVSTEKEEKEAARGGSVKTSTQTMDEQQITPSEGKPVQDMDVDGNQNE